MAYVVWRVLLKKYTKVRLGIISDRKVKVTPSERSHSEVRASDLSSKHSREGVAAWTEPRDKSPVDLEDDDEEFTRTATLSKSKRMKNYLQRKCRDVLGGGPGAAEEPAPLRSRSASRPRRRRDAPTSSWYVETVVDSRTEGGGLPQVVDPLEDKPAPPEEENIVTVEVHPEEVLEAEDSTEIVTDVGTLVDMYFGDIYPDYGSMREILVRQARDLLVCRYRGSLTDFETEFCVPASKEARLLRELSQGQVGPPCGWPLVSGAGGGVILRLGEVEVGALHRGDFYLCLGPAATIVSREGSWPLVPSAPSPHRYPLGPLSMVMAADPELTARLRDMLVSVEHALERVPLDLLAFPCTSCGLDDTCACSRAQPLPAQRVQKKDSSIQTSPMYEMDSSIPHIDSDDEHEHISCVGRCASFCPATRLSEIPESHLMAGIHLPGLHDLDGRAVAVFDLGSIMRVGLTPTECARVLLYYSTIPIRCERTERGLCVVALSADDSMELLDNCLSLVTEKIGKIIIFGDDAISTTTTVLPVCRLQFVVAKNRQELERYIAPDQIPLHCAGDTTHDQLQWIEFTKETECLISQCEDCGRRLIDVMAELGETGDLCSSETSRRQLHHQNRTIARLLGDTDLHRLRKDAPGTLEHLLHRAQWLSSSEDVRLGMKKAQYLFNEVDIASKKLEDLVDKRKEKLKDIARLKALEHETEQVLTWLSNKGDDWLRKHSELATTLPALKQQEQDFERFYFISMRHLDKGGDLVEEAGQCGGSGSSGLRDLARTLKNHLRGFSDRLEDTRERLEDTSRCFYLLDRAYEWALEAMKYMSRVKPEEAQNPETSLKQLRQYLMAHPPLPPEHFTEMLSLATKLENEKLLQQCKVAQSRCEETLEQVRSLLGTEPVRWGSSSNRRRSLPCQSSVGSNQCCHQPQLQLQDIAEECVCRSNNNVNPPLQRSCTWQYSPDSFDEEDKLSGDNTTEGSDTGTKSCEDVDETDACCGKPITPIPVNSHLHNDLAVELDAHCGTQTLKTKKTMLLIMREMIQTERDYVRSLEYVIENYIPELVREDIPQALRGQRNVIFGNIEKIYEFHSQYFLQELEKCEQSPLSVGQSFLRHENKFYLYALYNKNKPKSDSLMSEYGSAFFRAKQLELGDKMDLASYLLKPVQRMGKYALLLQQLMKASRQDSPDLRDAETMVRFQLRHGNDLLAMDSLRECDVNVKEQGRLLRQNEFLVWQGKGGKKYYRHVFLFEELILFSKARRFPDRKNLDLYIYKHSIKTSDIGLTAKVGDSTTKFEIWFRKRKPNDTFTLQSISEDIKQAWTDELSNLLWKQALKNRELRLAEMSSMGIGNKPCLDIRPSANQISDRSISIAQLSKTAPRFRNSIAVSPVEQVRKRPHSIISVSSSASSSGSSSSASSTGSNASSNVSSNGSSSGDHRQHSQCSSAESGIVSDWNPNESVSSDTTQLSVKL